MSEKVIDVDRREFLKVAGLSAIAATTAGTTAALLVDRKDQSHLRPPQIRPAEVSLPAESEQAANLVADLMAFRVENARLRTQLKAIERRLEISQLRSDGREDRVAETLQAQLAESAAESDSLAEEVAVLSGLVSLYEQLDKIDITAIAAEGAAAVEEIIAEIADHIPSAQEGLALGQQAMNDLEAQIPALVSGRNWLADRFEAIRGRLGDLESTIEGRGTILDLLAEWFHSLLEWLPFGIGKKAMATMDSIGQLAGEILSTNDDLDDNLMTALNSFLDGEATKKPVEELVLKPVRDELIPPAKKVVDRAAKVQAVYQSQLADPIAKASEERQTYLDLIATFRETHSL